MPNVVPSNCIEIWWADLDALDHLTPTFCSVLAPDERERGERLRFPLHRRRYAIRRGILRTLLGRYLDTAPASISFTYGSHGKPFLFGGELHFNLSHSGDQACFAFSSGSPLGIDLERIRPMPNLLRVAESFCSPADVTTLRGIPEEDQTRAFFKCWTRKEALVKALGKGLSYPLAEVSVSFDEPARLLNVPRGKGELLQWHFHDWETGHEHLGALVSRDSGSRIVQHRFDADS